ncbi:hypothetical protein SLA2020_140750 [Shorea laevis]
MKSCYQGWLFLLAATLLAQNLPYSQAFWRNENEVKTVVFLSPKFVLEPGSVVDGYYYNIDFPRGHIALKSFNAEVIDESGNPIPLHETYLHHWVVARYYRQRRDVRVLEDNGNEKLSKSDYMLVRNSGICQNHSLGQYFGLGSETRKTETHVPDPYGIEVGNPAEIPDGYEEQWMLNVHAIDTRGAEDKLGCIECRCDLYNVTEDEYGRPLRPDYVGGLHCCYDKAQCRVRKGFEGARRSLYLRYTVKWVDWDSSILPVKIYIFDVTDTWTRSKPEHHCQVEYDVGSCHADEGWTDNKRATLALPTGGYLIYGVAHQHAGGIGSSLYREGGQDICSSIPIYGDGKDAGNEAGYLVGMSTCYPQPGSVKISDGETLIVESRYSSAINHTGVMGLFYILVADQLPQSASTMHSLVQANGVPSSYLFAAVALIAVVAIGAGVMIHNRLKHRREDGYQPIVF